MSTLCHRVLNFRNLIFQNLSLLRIIDFERPKGCVYVCVWDVCELASVDMCTYISETKADTGYLSPIILCVGFGTVFLTEWSLSITWTVWPVTPSVSATLSAGRGLQAVLWAQGT